MSKITVLIVDDSAVVRTALKKILGQYEDIEVIGTAEEPYDAAQKIRDLRPDVLTLDIEMPGMDGLTFLSKIMKVRPMPVIMVSSLTEKGAGETLEAMHLGAVDFILKPNLGDNSDFKDFGDELSHKIRVASKVDNSREHRLNKSKSLSTTEHKKSAGPIKKNSNFVIAIGASTGGTETITEIIKDLPTTLPGIVITQHLPALFTRAFSERVNKFSAVTVKEAEHGDVIQDGCVYIAKGGKQMMVKKAVGKYTIVINDDPPCNRFKPSVDILFNSVADAAKKNCLGILLTGMGADGAQGLLKMKENGAHTIAQDEKSSVIFGMPKAAIDLGAASDIMNIQAVAKYLKNLV